MDMMEKLLAQIETLDVVEKAEAMELFRTLSSIDKAALNRVISVNDASENFPDDLQGNADFLGWLMENDVHKDELQLSLEHVVLLSSIFPGFSRAGQLLAAAARPN